MVTYSQYGIYLGLYTTNFVGLSDVFLDLVLVEETCLSESRLSNLSFQYFEFIFGLNLESNKRFGDRQVSQLCALRNSGERPKRLEVTELKGVLLRFVQLGRSPICLPSGVGHYPRAD